MNKNLPRLNKKRLTPKARLFALAAGKRSFIERWAIHTKLNALQTIV